MFSELPIQGCSLFSLNGGCVASVQAEDSELPIQGCILFSLKRAKTAPSSTAPMRLLLVSVVAATVIGADESARIAALEAEVLRLSDLLEYGRAECREEMASLSGRMVGEIAALRGLIDRTSAHATPMTSSSRVEANGSTDQRRRLTSTGTFVIAQASYELHEFPDSQGCQNVGGGNGVTSVLPIDGSNAVYGPKVASPSGEVSLATINNDWSTNEIDRYTAPLKVVHASDCASAPTLELPLATHVAGALTVGSTLAAQTLTAQNLTVGGVPLGAAPTWTDLALESGYSADAGGSYATPAWALINGIVHLRGKVCCSSDCSEECTSGSGGRIALMPAAARVSSTKAFIFAAHDSPWFARGGVGGPSGSNNGYLAIFTANNVKSVNLDAVSYYPD